jgi:nitroreductase
LIERVIYAATRASSPGNSQEWDVIVVRNPGAKRKIRDLLAPRFKAMVGFVASGEELHPGRNAIQLQNRLDNLLAFLP